MAAKAAVATEVAVRAVVQVAAWAVVARAKEEAEMVAAAETSVVDAVQALAELEAAAAMTAAGLACISQKCLRMRMYPSCLK